MWLLKTFPCSCELKGARLACLEGVALLNNQTSAQGLKDRGRISYILRVLIQQRCKARVRSGTSSYMTGNVKIEVTLESGASDGAVRIIAQIVQDGCCGTGHHW